MAAAVVTITLRGSWRNDHGFNGFNGFTERQTTTACRSSFLSQHSKIVIMKKEEFLMEATLRLITAKPQASMSEIADMAKELTNQVFNTANEMELEAETFWDKAIDKAPISTVISQIGKNRWDPGYRVRLTRIFKENNITTVGDLLRIGRQDFRKIREVGGGAISRIDDALEELFNLQNW